MESTNQVINRMLTNPSNFNEPIKVCKVCNQALEKDIDIEICGKTIRRRVGIACKCKLEENKLIEERLELQKFNTTMARFKAYSLHDQSFKTATFDNWIEKKENMKLKALGQRYCEQWKKTKIKTEGLIVSGPPGVGKSYFSFCVANELYKQGVTVLSISSTNLLNMILDTYNKHGDRGENEILNDLKACSLLILDDLGAEKKTEWAINRIYSIIESRSNAKKPMIITTNLSGENLSKHLTGNDGVDRTHNRIKGMCIPINVNGDSWRERDIDSRKVTFMKELQMI